MTKLGQKLIAAAKKSTGPMTCISKAMGGEWCVGRCLDTKDCSAKPLITAAIINAPPNLNNRPLLKKYIEDTDTNTRYI